MNRYALYLGILLLFATSGIYSLEWPASPVIPVKLFAQAGSGVLERGLILSGSEHIRTASHGQLVITLEENKNMRGFPGTLGNAAIIAHDDGLVSVYGNLDSLERIIDKTRMEDRFLLAEPGTSAWGTSGTFLFQVFDRKERQLINPLLLLPTLADRKPPRIRSAILLSGTGATVPLVQNTTVRQGKYKVYADIIDTVDDSATEVGVFRISVLVNGTEISVIPMEILVSGHGKTGLSRNMLLQDDLYHSSGMMYLGEIALSRGRSELIISARDFAGNERSRQTILKVE